MQTGQIGGVKIGLFGKLPSKRDFISYGVDRGVLEVVEPWLQGAIAASRDQLGQEWLANYMNAPIWRFWLGPELCGSVVAGVLMPSVDGVGRYFPLVLMAAGAPMASPAVEPDAQWYRAAERILLGALDDGRSFDEVMAAIGALPAPMTMGAASTVEGAFGAILREGMPALDAALSYWWIGPYDGVPIKAIMRRGMPGPYDYIEMIRPIPMPEPAASEEPELALSLTGGSEDLPLTGGADQELPLSGGNPAAQAEQSPAIEDAPTASPFSWDADPDTAAPGKPDAAEPGQDDRTAEDETDEAPEAETKAEADGEAPKQEADGDELVLGNKMKTKGDV